MSAAATVTAGEQEHVLLLDALAHLRVRVERYAQLAEGPAAAAPCDGPSPPAPPGVRRLAAAFALTPFESDVLLLCAGAELDGAFGRACVRAGGVTFALALAALADPHWSALTPARPLRRWRLVELDVGQGVVGAPLRIDERVLHLVAGVSQVDERLLGLVEPVAAGLPLARSQAVVAGRMAELWGGAEATPVELETRDADTARVVAAEACARLGMRLHALRARDVPAAAAERRELALLWRREALLERRALVVELDPADDAPTLAAAAGLADLTGGAVALVGRAASGALRRPAARLTLGSPTREEREAIWLDALGDSAAELNGELSQLSSQFELGTEAIGVARARARAGGGPLAARLWEACREQARPRLDDLGVRVEPEAGWDDLVVPPPQRATLRQIVVHARRRATVLEEWGFARRSERGLGLTALFAGPSGTGKTLAAEVIAHELSLDLFVIDLSAVVDKYVGETEKNLRRVFDAAEGSGAILLFDEADALFGRRTEVRDSLDRFANVQVGYLLQRLESYRGLGVLTTNDKGAIDPAFLRRLRFVVDFPFPTEAERLRLWQLAFPGDVPTDGLDQRALARLNVAGASIGNIALAAAYLAADEDAPVRMAHVLEAARRECEKLGRQVTEAETAGWT